MTMTWSPAWIGQPPSSVSSRGDAGDADHRRLPAQQLLDRGRDERRVVDELPAVLGVLREVARTCSRAWR